MWTYAPRRHLGLKDDVAVLSLPNMYIYLLSLSGKLVKRLCRISTFDVSCWSTNSIVTR